jgi:hypothetical protein
MNRLTERAFPWSARGKGRRTCERETAVSPQNRPEVNSGLRKNPSILRAFLLVGRGIDPGFGSLVRPKGRLQGLAIAFFRQIVRANGKWLADCGSFLRV